MRHALRDAAIAGGLDFPFAQDARGVADRRHRENDDDDGLQALSPAFCHEERAWYGGLTVLDQNVIPVVNPQGFLTEQELLQLDAAAGALLEAQAASASEVGLMP